MAIDWKRARALTFGSVMLSMGTLHFVKKEEFESIVPPRLPGGARFYNYASGIWELATGAAVMNERTRSVGGWSAVALLLAVWPANMYHARKDWNQSSTGVGKKLYHVLRQPAQLLIIREALQLVS
ncbi:hypothetical protein [Corynebacterium sp. c25Ua_89]|uniref:DoxX family protein n=1 Tax=Corynebacterium sp. c25Ua_89 TaxID=3032356 RepID=UPI0039C0FE85